MPMYTYGCHNCDHEFTEVLSVKFRAKPIDMPCPACGIKGPVYKKIDSPLLHTGTGMNMSAKMDGVDPGVMANLSRIKANNPGMTGGEYIK